MAYYLLWQLWQIARGRVSVDSPSSHKPFLATGQSDDPYATTLGPRLGVLEHFTEVLRPEKVRLCPSAAILRTGISMHFFSLPASNNAIVRAQASRKKKIDAKEKKKSTAPTAAVSCDSRRRRLRELVGPEVALVFRISQGNFQEFLNKNSWRIPKRESGLLMTVTPTVYCRGNFEFRSDCFLLPATGFSGYRQFLPVSRLRLSRLS